MPETQDDTPNNKTNPELEELMKNVAKMNDGLSGLVTSALRMQMLILEDSQNMMAEFQAAADATRGRNNGKDDN